MKSVIDPVPRLQVLSHCSEAAEPKADSDAAVPLLLIEHRDEVFARLVADLRNFGCAVERAATVDDAVRCCRRQKMALILCYRDLPDESGWLIASKLRFIDPLTKIWLYAASFAAFDQIGAQYSGVEDLVYYKGDLASLSRQLTARLWNLQHRLPGMPDRVPQDPIAQADAHMVLVRSLRSFRSVA